MNFIYNFIEKKRLILSLVAFFSIMGMVMWFTMVRQEDPRMPSYWGLVVIPYPGADAPTTERLILDPTEDSLAEVSEIKNINATAFDEVVVINLELKDDVSDFNMVWDDIREALDKAYTSFPEGAGKPVLDDEMQDQDSIVLAITGSSDALALLSAARKIKDSVIKLPQVAKVHLISDPGEQITIDLDDAVANRLGLDANLLAGRLSLRNQTMPGGSLKVGEKTVRLKPVTEFADLTEIADTQILLPSGSSVPLSSFARVHKGPAEPASSIMRYNGIMSVGIAIVPVKSINLVRFGDIINKNISALQDTISPLSVDTVFFQPKRTETRINELSNSLVLGIFIVAGVLIFTMGVRLGLLVAAIVPLVTMTSLLMFAWGNGVLHQISIAALVLALGMLVDNAIVMAEGIQYRLDKGINAKKAAVDTVKELYTPLASATLTTLAAFVPMLIAKGPTAMFTKTIPVMIMLTLSLSYVYAVFVTPVLSEMFLKPKRQVKTGKTEKAGKRFAEFTLKRPFLVISVALLSVAVSFASMSKVKQQFFPASDRNQFVIDLKLKEGSHLDATDQVSRMIENVLMAKSETTSVSSYIGRSAPKFYYNIMAVPFSPHFAQIVVETQDKADIDPLLSFIRIYVKENLPEAEIVARKLEQGPPVNAPVEIRLFGNDFHNLDQSALVVAHALEQISGTVDIRHDLGPGAPTIHFSINDAEAGRYGITRADAAMAIYGRTRGIPVGELRTDDDPVPIVIRSSKGEKMPVEDLSSILVPTRDRRFIPLSQIAVMTSLWQPAAVKHRNTQRVVTVSSQLMEGYTFSDIIAAFKKQLPELNLPDSISVQYGGDAEGSGEANMSLMKSFPIGFLLLFVVLIAEFNSFRNLFIILITIPLATAGIVPGLLLSSQPFGFMSLLGVIALVGIVVNNAIVLLDIVEDRRKHGLCINDALTEAVSRRTRPILLTMMTTIAGLLPLAFSSSTLWPPLAWAMISGLLASTLLTLIIVPALYKVLFSSHRNLTLVKPATLSKAACFLLMAIPFSTDLNAEPVHLSLQEVMKRAENRPALKSALYQAKATDKALEAEKRAARFPVLSSQAAYSMRDRDVATIIDVPGLGTFSNSIGDREHTSAGIMIIQPIFDPARNIYGIPAAAYDAEAKHLMSERKRQELSAEAAMIYLQLLSIDANIKTTRAYSESLKARLKEMENMVAVGRVLKADQLKVLLFYEQANQKLTELRNYRRIVQKNLSRATNTSELIEPLPVNDLSEKVIPDVDFLKQAALKNRPDILALKKSIAALKKNRSAVKASSLPSLKAVGKWVWDDGLSSYSEDNWWEGSINITWTPVAAATRFSKSAELSAQIQALQNELTEIKTGVALEIQSGIVAIQNAKGALDVEQRGVFHATETLRIEKARHSQGRATTNDLLDAEAQLRERQTEFEIARIDIVQGWIELRLSVGSNNLSL